MRFSHKYLIVFALLLTQIIIASNNKKSPFHFKSFDATIVDKATNKTTISFKQMQLLGEIFH